MGTESNTHQADTRVTSQGYSDAKYRSELARRGLLLTAEGVFGVSPILRAGRAAAVYPVFDTSGGIIDRRYKYLSGQGSKYAWAGQGTPRPRYYHAADILEQIQAAQGVLWLANGEPAVWSYYAAGVSNVLSIGFGEGNIPATLAADLVALGVTEVRYPADKDSVGLKSAAKVRDALAGSGIVFKPLHWPDELPEKSDANDLWIAVQFDPARFKEALGNLAALLLPKEERQPVVTVAHQHDDAAFSRWIHEAVIPAVERAADKRRGKHFRCINPDHADKNPSARISTDKNPDGLYICTCGAHSWGTVAGWLGVPDFKAWLKEQRPAGRAGRAKAPNMLKTGATAGAVFTPRLPGDVTGDAQYMADLPIPAGDVLLIGDTGTGKTRWIATNTASGSLLAITHRVALSRNLAQGLATEHYQDIDRQWLAAAPRLTICADSLLHIATSGQIPTFDVVVLDEVEQLLHHVATSDTLKRNRQTVFNALGQVVRQARRVIAADAYAGQISLDWLTETRGQPSAVVTNTHTRQRGKLTTYSDKTGMISATLEAVEQQRGTVVLAVSSIRLAKRIAKIAAARFGSMAVLAVHQDSSGEPEVKAFLANPNEQIAHYRLVIYSPTVGSGVDITTPIFATFGLFLAEPIDGYDAHQMLNRCRNVEQTHIYVETRGSSREINPDVIEQESIENAIRTGQVAQFDRFGLVAFREDQRAVVRLAAKFTANSNTSKNRLADHVLELAAGYTDCRHNNTENPAIWQEIQSAKETIHTEDMQRTIAAEPVSREQFDALVSSGKLETKHRHGHLRWLVEQATGEPITEETYQRAADAADRAALYLLADVLFATGDELKQLDRSQAEHGLIDRGHYTRKVHLIRGLLRILFGSATVKNTATFSRDELRFNTETWLLNNGDEWRRLFGRRAGRTNNPIALVRWLLNRIGLRLASKQVRRGKYFEMVYTLDQAYNAAALRYAQQLRTRQTEVCVKSDNRKYFHSPVFTHLPVPPPVPLPVTGENLPQRE